MGGVTNPASKPAGIGENADPAPIGHTEGDLPSSERRSLRRVVPGIGTPSASGPMGSRGEPASPDFRIGGSADGGHGGGREKGGIVGGKSPPPSKTIGRSKDLRSKRIGEERGGPGLEIRVPRPEFPSSSSAETPMSCEKGSQTAGEDSGDEFPLALSPNSRFHRPRRPMERGGSRFSESENPLPRGNSPPQTTNQRCRPSEGTTL